MNQTKQNAPYGYYELGLRADRLQVELEAACRACTHLDEKLKEADERTQHALVAQRLTLVERDAAESRANAAEAKLQAVEALLKKPGCWSEWARECLVVLGGGK